jgi:hypothetical protein
MKIEKGATVWLPCEIRSGPFASERRVLVRTTCGDEWFGFVDLSDLDEEKKLVRARVVRIHDGNVTLAIRGHSPASHAVRAEKSTISTSGCGAIAS